jgi:hypothetical protein
MVLLILKNKLTLAYECSLYSHTVYYYMQTIKQFIDILLSSLMGCLTESPRRYHYTLFIMFKLCVFNEVSAINSGIGFHKGVIFAHSKNV